MAASFTIGGHAFKAGSTVSAYPRAAVKSDGSVSGTAVATATADSTQVTFTGLGYSTKFVAVGVDESNAPRLVQFTTGVDPSLEFATIAYVDSQLAGAAASGLKGFYNVKDPPASYGGVGVIGAAGDGITTDDAPMDAAVTYAKANGGVVYCPPGTYKRTTAWDHSNSTKAFRVTGFGNGGRGHINAGSPTILWTGAAASGPVVKAYSVHGYSLDNLHFVYSVNGYDGDIIDCDGGPLLSDCTNFSFYNLSFRGNAAGGHFLTARSNIRFNKAIIGKVFDCHFADAVNLVRLADPGGSYVVSIAFAGNTYNNSTDTHHVLIGSSDAEAISFDDETWEAGNSTGAIRGATTAGDGGQNQIYTLSVTDSWCGDASAPVTWFKNLHTVGGRPVRIEGNLLADNGSSTTPHISGDGIFLIRGNSITGGDIFQYVNGGASATIVNLEGNSCTVRKKINNWTSSFTVSEKDNTFSYNGSFPQTVDNTPYDRVSSSRLAAGGSGKPQQPDWASGLVEEDLILGAFTNAYIPVAAVDKGGVFVGKMPNPSGVRALMNFAPGSGGSWAVLAGATQFTVLEVQGGASLAACKIGLFGVTPVVQAARAGQLTDSTGGAVSSTLAAGITDTVAKNAIASLAAKYNAIETMLHNIGISA